MIERELRRQILARPDDDELRLVYADELEEAGQLDRAELIRARERRRSKRARRLEGAGLFDSNAIAQVPAA